MLRYGHRGARGYAPENTLASIKKALELGVDGIEFDVYALYDGTVIVIHDKTVDRTTNGKGDIEKKTLKEIKQLDAGNKEKIPTLHEVLDVVNRKAIVNIELKGKGTAMPVANIINTYVKEKAWKYNDFLVSSFNHQELQAFNKILPQVRIGVLITFINRIFLQPERYKKDFSAYSLHLWEKFTTKSVVKKIHKHGLKVFVYTVNEETSIEKMKTFGVDCIISDYPDRI